MLLDEDEISNTESFDFSPMGDKLGFRCERTFGLPLGVSNYFYKAAVLDLGFCLSFLFNAIFAVYSMSLTGLRL